MLDHNPESSRLETRQRPVRNHRLSSRRIGLGGAFASVSIWTRWNGAPEDLADLMQNADFGQPFNLAALYQLGDVIWDARGAKALASDASISAGEPVIVVFECKAGSEGRAEAHVPRLLEAVGARVSWTQIRKHHVGSELPNTMFGDETGDWSSFPIEKSLLEGFHQ